MIELNSHNAHQKRGWMSAVVLLLLGFLINLPFAGQSFAATIDFSATRSLELLQQGAVNSSRFIHDKPCLHHKRSIIQTGIDHDAQALHGTSLHMDQNIHKCCGNTDIAGRTLVGRDRSRIAKPIFLVSAQPGFAFVGEWQLGRLAQVPATPRIEKPQLLGLLGAQEEFLRTQRHLI